jgi:rubrerythrin
MEKEQSLAYRAFAAGAEGRGLPDLAQRFHDLHADEQHHLSRLTARILELRLRPEELDRSSYLPIPEDGWEDDVRRREATAAEEYRRLLEYPLDPVTRALLEEILEVERHHASELGGKWTLA